MPRSSSRTLDQNSKAASGHTYAVVKTQMRCRSSVNQRELVHVVSDTIVKRSRQLEHEPRRLEWECELLRAEIARLRCGSLDDDPELRKSARKMRSMRPSLSSPRASASSFLALPALPFVHEDRQQAVPGLANDELTERETLRGIMSSWNLGCVSSYECSSRYFL